MDKNWFEQLTEDQKAKLLSMGENVTFDQLVVLCREEKFPLPDDFFDDINGGGADFDFWIIIFDVLFPINNNAQRHMKAVPIGSLLITNKIKQTAIYNM